MHWLWCFPRRGRITILLALALTLLAACAQSSTKRAAYTPAPCDPATQWHAPANNTRLDDLAMVSPDEGWAVGALTWQLLPAAADHVVTHGQWPPAAPDYGPAGVIYHLTHGQWQPLPQTYPGAELFTISMDSPDDGWAASNFAVTGTGDRVLVLHYTGGGWQPVDVPALDAVLKGPTGTSGSFIQWISVQMFGPDAGWMFAWTNIPRDPSVPRSGAEVVILRYENGVWTPIAAPSVPPEAEMFTLSAVSASEAWIVATDYGNDLKTLFAHYSDGAWTLRPSTFPSVTENVVMLSPTDGWAFGSGGSPTLLLHYDGTAWATVATPNWGAHQIQLAERVFAVSPGVLWFSANQGYGSDASWLFEQYAGGQWRQLTWPFTNVHPMRLVAVATGELWGIGDVEHQEGCPGLANTSIPQGVFLHDQQGSWSQEVLP